MWLLCALVLSQAEPSPPPLVPLDIPIPPPGSEAPSAPPPPPQPGVVPAPTPGIAQPEPSYDLRRVGITGVVTAGVTALGLTGSILGIQACGSNNDGSCQAAIAVAGIPLTWIAAGLGGWLVHRALDGQGSFASSMAGASIGAGAAATAWLVATSFGSGTINDGGQVALTTLSALFVGAGVGFMVELSNIRTINENREAGISVALMPGKGGGTLVLGGRF